MSLVDDLLARFQMQQDQANAMNEKRYQQGLGIYDQIISQYAPGGSFGAGVEAQIEKGATKAVAQGTQTMVNAGLGGTTTRGNLRKKYEEDVATPARLQLEDMRADRLANAQAQKAGFIERREDTGPSSELIASLAKTAGTATSGSGGAISYTTIGNNKVSASARNLVADGKLFRSVADKNRYLQMNG